MLLDCWGARILLSLRFLMSSHSSDRAQAERSRHCEPEGCELDLLVICISFRRPPNQS